MTSRNVAKAIPPSHRPPPPNSGPPLFLPIKQPIDARHVYVDDDEVRETGGNGIWQYPSKRMSILLTLAQLIILFCGVAALIVHAVAWTKLGENAR